MKILEELSKKIDELKIASDNDKDKIILEEEKKIVEECIEVLKDDEKFFDYNFASIINVLDMEHVDIEDLDRRITDLKETIDVRKKMFNIPFSYVYESVGKSSTITDFALNPNFSGILTVI